jgi:ribosomal-protein-alanine N-acetyltransferase
VADIEQSVFSDPWPATAFRTLLGPFAWVAETGPGCVAGYVFARRTEEEAEILNLAVCSDLRRRGVGRALLEHVLAELARAGARRVFLEVRESNEAGRTFYGQMGFAAVGRRLAYYARPREDALLLSREIEPRSGSA